MQNNETKPPSYTPHKKKFKMIKDLNVRPETIKNVEENIVSQISDIACYHIIVGICLQARETIEKINNCHYIKLKSFCIGEVNMDKISKPTKLENIFTNTFVKGLISKIYKEHIKQH